MRKWILPTCLALALLVWWTATRGGPAEPSPLDPSAPPSLAGLEARIAAREYHASENDLGLQAPNRVHNLRTYFDPTGIRVHDRTAAGSPELLRLSLSGMGRDGELTQIEPGAEVVARENRIEIRRPGLVEWFVNGPEGLEQGFTIAEPPRGDGRLRLELSLEGAYAMPRGKAMIFATATGRNLTYGELAVVDARGEPLVAEFALADAGRVAISVEDAAAVYPITVDPLLDGFANGRIEADEASAYLGTSVASAGDVNGDGYGDVIVGAYGYDSGQSDEGAAFIFLGSANGIPNAGPLTAQTQLESDQVAAFLGASVASAGDVNGDGYGDVIVGAWAYDHGQDAEGAAFVFLGSATGVADGNPTTAHAQLEADQASAFLGASVASAGDVNGDGYGDVIVGAYQYGDGQVGEGAAFVFLGSATGLADGNPATAHARLEADQNLAQLGFSVASAGDVNGDGFGDVIVGAPKYDDGESDEGAAFVFLGSASGLANGNPASAHARIEADQVNAALGSSVASAGDVNGDGLGDVIVGAPQYDRGQADEGVAFVFLGGATGLANGNPATAHAVLESDQAGAIFGVRVASAGDVNGDGYSDVIVGAVLYDDGQADEGGAFVFLGSALGVPSANVHSTTVHAQIEVNQAIANLGQSVAAAGDVNGDGYGDVIVGAWQYSNGQTLEGAAFIYHGGAKGIFDGTVGSPASRLESNQPGAAFGESIASAGDVNGDGFGDVIVGAPQYDDGQSNEGAAFIFYGSADGIPDANPVSANTRLESNQADAVFGSSVAAAGDVNGDGYGDVIVGSRSYDDGESNEGAAFVFLGSPGGVANGNPATAHARFECDQPGAGCGWAVASAGDVNGDGYSDVLVGARFYDSGQTDEGAAFVLLGSTSGLPNGSPATAHARLESDQDFATFYWGSHSVASAGDVNGDGYADVIVGFGGYTSGQAIEGGAFIFHGSATGLTNGSPSTAQTRLQSDQVAALLGFSVASAGDVNGDGYADVIVGAPSFDDPIVDQGAAFVFLGRATGIPNGTPASASRRIELNLASGQLGWSVAGAGDVNGDGYADMIVGSSQATSGQATVGANVFLGYPGGVGAWDAQLVVGAPLDMLGESVASAGDVNGDGFADVIVGAIGYDGGEADEGAAFVFRGGGNRDGRVVRARQRRGDGSGKAVEPWGETPVAAFSAELRGNHPQGTGRVNIQIEACPSGVAFGDASCANTMRPSWVSVNGTTPDVLISRIVSGLVSDRLYRWRARVLYATATGPIPAHPSHGPWRRLGAQALEADIRVPEPGWIASMAAGTLLLAGLVGRRLRD